MTGFGITIEQQQLLSFLPTQSSAPNLQANFVSSYKKSRKYIVDNGASHHFIDNGRGLSHMHERSQFFPVSFPDGSHISFVSGDSFVFIPNTASTLPACSIV